MVPFSLELFFVFLVIGKKWLKQNLYKKNYQHFLQTFFTKICYGIFLPKFFLTQKNYYQNIFFTHFLLGPEGSQAGPLQVLEVQGP